MTEVKAIEMTSKYCKGMIYQVSDEEAKKGIKDKIFVAVTPEENPTVKLVEEKPEK